MPKPASCARTRETTAQIRIMDPAIISPTVRQLEQYRAYYQFKDPLDVDRYEIDGESQDTVVSVRELNVDQLGRGDVVAELDARLHARLRPGRRGGQRAHDRRQPGVPRARHPRDGLPVRRARTSSRACTSASTPRRTRSSARPRAPSRSSSTTRRAPTARPRRRRRSRATAGRASAASSTGSSTR